MVEARDDLRPGRPPPLREVHRPLASKRRSCTSALMSTSSWPRRPSPRAAPLHPRRLRHCKTCLGFDYPGWNGSTCACGRYLQPGLTESVKGTETPDSTSSSKFVLMNETAEDIASSHTPGAGKGRGRILHWIRHSQVQTAMRASRVVVGHVGPKYPL